MTGFVDWSDGKVEKKRMAEGCCSSSSLHISFPSSSHLVTELNASSISVASTSSVPRCVHKTKPKASKMYNDRIQKWRLTLGWQANLFCPLTLPPFPISSYRLWMHSAIETRKAGTSVNYRELFLEHFAPRVSQAAKIQAIHIWYYKKAFINVGKYYMHIVCLSKIHIIKE